MSEQPTFTELVEERIAATLTDYKWVMGHAMVAQSSGGVASIPLTDLAAVAESMQKTHALLTTLLEKASAGNGRVGAALEKMRQRQTDAADALREQAAAADAQLKSAAPLGGEESES